MTAHARPERRESAWAAEGVDVRGTVDWYLLQTKAGQEKLALENLERQKYHPWLPKLRVRRRRGVRIEPMFPGYLFVQLNPTVDNFGPIRSTLGVLRLVQFGSVYARLPERFVMELRQRADEHGICESAKPTLHAGDRVEIIDGVLSGYEAVVAEIKSRDRIALLLDIAGRHVALVAPTGSVQPVG